MVYYIEANIIFVSLLTLLYSYDEMLDFKNKTNLEIKKEMIATILIMASLLIFVFSVREMFNVSFENQYDHLSDYEKIVFDTFYRGSDNLIPSPVLILAFSSPLHLAYLTIKRIILRPKD